MIRKKLILVPFILSITLSLAYLLPQTHHLSHTLLGDYHSPGFPKASAATSISSVKSGNWSDPTVWSTGSPPSSGDMIAISMGHTVTYDVQSDAVLGEVTVNGTLKFSRATSTRLKTSDNIIVMQGGFLDLGTPEDFIPRDTKAEIIFVLTQKQADAYVDAEKFNPASKGLWVMPNGRWETHGAPLLRTWSKLALDAPSGANSLVVANDVTDWYVGGTVAVSQTNMPTNFNWSDRLGREDSGNSQPQHEVRAITSLESVSGGRTRITLDQPLEFFHEGTAPFQGDVGLLTRNVVIRTELLDMDEQTLIKDVRTRKFAHTMYMAHSQGNVQYAEFKFMGHYGKLGVYPIHLHRMLESSRGMIVRGTSGWYNGFRCVNLHVTHGVLVEDNVCLNAQSVSFFSERDNSIGTNQDNAFVHNLAIANEPKPFEDRSSSVHGEHGPQHGVDFYPGQKTDNEAYLGNVSAGAAWTRQGASGYHFPEGGNGFRSDGLIPWTFVSNEVYSKPGPGLNAWQNVGAVREMIDTRLWRNNDGVQWGAYGNPFRFFNGQFLENATAGFRVTSNDSYLQDSVITGTTADGSMDDYGFFINAYIREQWPTPAVWLVRNHFKDLPSAAIFQTPATCDQGDIRDRPLLGGNCSAFYTVHMGNTFESVGQSISFGMQANPNSFARVFDHPESIDGSTNFVLTRKDLTDPAKRGVITEKLINDRTFYSANVDALVTPMSELPLEIEFAGLLNFRAIDEQFKSPSPDFMFTTTPDYPPEISLDVEMDGTVATFTAVATDDNQVTRVEFLADWITVGTLTAPNAGSNSYQITVDLADLSDPSEMPARKYAFLYARALDGTFHKPRGRSSEGESWEQRAYSNVVKIGPEVLVAGQALPTPPATDNQPLSVHAGPDITISLSENASLNGSVTNDGPPESQGAVILDWSLVSGPGDVSFADSDAAATSATFTEAGTYTLRLTANDGNLSLLASDDITVTVNPNATDKEVPGYPLAISDLTVASGKNYEVAHDDLESGARVYIDRDFTFSSLPGVVSGATYIQTANDDKDAGQEVFLSFNVDRPVTVFVSYDSRASSLPNWLASWINTGHSVGTTDVSHNLFSKEFPAGAITLGGNLADGASGTRSNYSVALVPSDPANQAPIIDAGPDLEVTLASPVTASLSAEVTDDGLPNPPGVLALQWSLISGPSSVDFADPSAVATSATFTQAGIYVLRLTADDGELSASHDLSVTVNPEPEEEEKEATGDPLAISDLTVASGKGYQVVYDGLESGARVYIDRDFTFSSLPDVVSGATYIMTANDDKDASREDFLSFQVNQPVTVYVAYDARLSIPNWLAGWTPTGDTLDTTDTPRNIFARDFPKGSVTLGGNNTSKAGSNYSVTVIAQGGEAQPDNQASVEVLYGDATLDGHFTVDDTYLVMDWLLGDASVPEPGIPAFIAADVDGDGKVSLDDVDLMIQKLQGEIDKFPTES